MRAHWLLISLIVILGNINSVPALTWQPESSLVGLYDIGSDSDSTGYMAFNITVALTLTGFNESSQYYRSAKSEKIVAIRYEFVEQGIVEREVFNTVMASSNATESHVQNETFVEWTIQTPEIQHSFFANNLQLGDNTFRFDIEFEIEFLEEPELILEEISFGLLLHLDGIPSDSPSGSSNQPSEESLFPWFSILVVTGVSAIVIVGAVALRWRLRSKVVTMQLSTKVP